MSAAFDVVFDFDFRCMTDDSKIKAAVRPKPQIKIRANFKGVGQECPTHTKTNHKQNLLLVDVLPGFQALGESL